MSWRANCVTLASSMARSLGCHRISGWRLRARSPRISPVIILPEALAAIRRQHRMAEAQMLAALREGVALMCVAEALLRIPDTATADALLRDKLAQGDWAPSADDPLLASAADWALLLTGKLARWHDEPSPLKHIVARLGEPVVRAAVRQAMRILAEQFVLAETIEDAVRRGAERAPYVHSYDMLGEAARTAADAARYLELYANAIRTVRPPDTLSIKL